MSQIWYLCNYIDLDVQWPCGTITLKNTIYFLRLSYIILLYFLLLVSYFILMLNVFDSDHCYTVIHILIKLNNFTLKYYIHIKGILDYD